MGYQPTNYKKGATKEVKKMRKKNFTKAKKTGADYRFHTLFHQDFYETVIMTRKTQVSESQWVDWNHVAHFDNPIFNQVIAACERTHIKKLMGFKYDWNKEIIAQFYASLFVEEAGNVRKMHWTTEGRWYEISYRDFAAIFCFKRGDCNRLKIHIRDPLRIEEMAFMYPPNERHNVGTPMNMYTFYSVLNRMFRKTLAPKDGNPSEITLYARNLLAMLRDGAPPFSVIDYLWREIKSISLNPIKTCGFAPYLMFIIEEVTNTEFPKDTSHEPFRPFPTKDPIIMLPTPPPQPEQEQQSQHSEQQQQFEPARPEQWQTPSPRRREKSTSPIKKLFNMVFGMCKTQHDMETRAREERAELSRRLRRIERAQFPMDAELYRRLRRIERAQFPMDVPSPPEQDEQQTNPPTPLMERYNRWQQEDYYSQIYGPSNSSGPTGGFDGSTSGQHAGGSMAPPPSDQPRRGVIEELGASLLAYDAIGHWQGPCAYTPINRDCDGHNFQ